MRKRGPAKIHITLSVEPEIWASFQKESAVRKLTASEQFQKFMSKELARWGKKKKETK